MGLTVNICDPSTFVKSSNHNDKCRVTCRRVRASFFSASKMFSPTQKKLSEEGSSGSDAGSEVGLEPETDRFGFILTNGSTDGSVGPPPELVRQRETIWINIISQWDRILSKKTSKVKVQCQKGIPASLRAKCWPLLCGASDKMKQTENLYQYLDSKPALQSWVDVIERDLGRQFPFHEMFLSKDGHGQRGLFRVLKAYTQYQPEDGYCQAQGPVAAVLLMNMPAEEAFWCLVQISEEYLPGYYNPLLEGVLFDAAMLSWVLKRTSPAAHKHLQHHGVEPLMFATDWLMCLFTRHLPFNTLLRVWDLFFCQGVRVLLQVAVVLVRRVLGRPEQRKQCQGQMETLERLRGIREEVREEDDTFIAEVCSVQLSAKDLEKQTEKELEKWRKDRPSSTFDPRGRCQGYRMAWMKARQIEEERDREEREKGNLSVPLARSASALSLSPSLLHKRWRKGGKTNTREWEGGGGRVVRHLSMGAKEDYRRWSEMNFKKVQRVQEEQDVALEEHRKPSEAKLTEPNELKELLEEPQKIEKQNMPAEHIKEKAIAEEQIEQMEGSITGKEERQLKEKEESKVLSECVEETNVETQQSEGPSEDQTENILQPAEDKQREELDCNSQVKYVNKETEKQVEESEYRAAVEGNQTEIQKDADADTNTDAGMQEHVSPSEEQFIQDEMKPEESTGTENVHQTQMDTIATETDVKDPKIETEIQQLLQDMITETDRSTQADAFEEPHHSTESETDMIEESHTQTETETDELEETQEKVVEVEATQELEAEIVQIDSERDTDSKTEAFPVCSPESIEQKEGTDLAVDTETEENDRVTDSSEAFENECDKAASEPTQQEAERSLSAHSEAQAEETTKAAETADSITPPLEKVTSTQAETPSLTAAEPDGKESSVETSEEPASVQPMSVGAVEEGESTKSVQGVTVGGDDVFISAEPTDSPNTDGNTQVQDKDSHLVKDQTELDNRGLKQASGHRSNRSSGDLCVRKSSNSRLTRRLSEDLFNMPEKTDHPEVKHSESVNPTQSPPHVASEAPSPPNPPKRFGLFRRLRGEQPKKTKGTPKIQVPKILIQDFSDGTGMGKLVEEEGEKKLSARERRRRRRDRERREKEEANLRKKREKELGKEKERERATPQTRGKSFQVQREKGSSDVTQPAKTGSQKLRYSASYAESYF